MHLRASPTRRTADSLRRRRQRRPRQHGAVPTTASTCRTTSRWARCRRRGCTIRPTATRITASRRRPVPLPPRFRPASETPLTRTAPSSGPPSRTVSAETERVPFDPDRSARRAIRVAHGRRVPAITLQSQTGALTEDWTQSARPAVQSAADHALRGRDRARRRRDTALRRRRARRAPGRGNHIRRALPGRQRRGRQRRRGDHRPRRHRRRAHRRGGNPLAARGGIDPETAAQIRRSRTQAFRTQERAVTPADYAEVTERHAGVQRAAATLRWTGSWHTVFITVDRAGGEPVDAAFDRLARAPRRPLPHGRPRPALRRSRLRLARARPPRVRGARPFPRRRARRPLEVLGSGVLRRRPARTFHPDNFSFGQTVYLSPALRRGAPGPGRRVGARDALQRQGREETTPRGRRLPRARAARDRAAGQRPELPEHGVLRLELSGGK